MNLPTIPELVTLLRSAIDITRQAKQLTTYSDEHEWADEQIQKFSAAADALAGAPALAAVAVRLPRAQAIAAWDAVHPDQSFAILLPSQQRRLLQFAGAVEDAVADAASRGALGPSDSEPDGGDLVRLVGDAAVQDAYAAVGVALARGADLHVPIADYTAGLEAALQAFGAAAFRVGRRPRTPRGATPPIRARG